MKPLGEIAKELVRLRIEAERGATLEARDNARTGATGAADRMASTTKSLREGKPSMALAYGWEGQPMGNSVKGRGPCEPAPVHRGKRQNSPREKGAGFDYVVYTNHAVLTSTRKPTGVVDFLVVVK